MEVTALEVIQPELIASLEKAVAPFEAFVEDRSATEKLSESEHCIGDIVGILKMLQIPGALQLAEEMLKMLQKLNAQPTTLSDFSISALSQAFVWIPCFIGYVADREQVLPSLALSFINQLRAGLGEPLVLESELAEFQCSTPISLALDGAKRNPDLGSQIPRLRLMYQVGLTGLLREENLELKIQLMQRAVGRLASSVGDAPVRTQWRLTEAVLEGLANGDLQLGYTRKRVLSFIERKLRAFEKDHEDIETTASTELLNELVYLVNLSGSSGPASTEVFDRLGLKPFEVTDRDFQQEQAVMQGPNAETVLVVVSTLQKELLEIKTDMEAAEQDPFESVDISPLISLFRRASDILSVVGLQTAGEILARIRSSIESWADSAEYSEDNLMEVANGLLYLESTLANLSRSDLNVDATDDEQSEQAMIARNQLDEAEAIIIQEAQVGLAESKDEIRAFEEDQHILHISNVAEKLVTVRGAIQLLKLDKAAAVLISFEKYVQSIAEQGLDEENTQGVLNTMADALISLEYYLSEIELHGVAPPNILDVAEQSLSAD